MRDVFADWNQGELGSYLIEITADIMGYRDETGEAVVDVILDAARHKGHRQVDGPGRARRRTTADAHRRGGLRPVPRGLEGRAGRRGRGAARPRRQAHAGARHAVIGDLRQALYAAKIVSYAQGYQLMRAVAVEHDWDLDYGGIALIWRGGCIIRSVFLKRIKEAFDRTPTLTNLLLDPFFVDAVHNAQPAWRRVVKAAVDVGIPMPALSAALAYFDGYRTARLPANLLQAQRDYFGAHTYERLDRAGVFHTNWTSS